MQWILIDLIFPSSFFSFTESDNNHTKEIRWVVLDQAVNQKGNYSKNVFHWIINNDCN